MSSRVNNVAWATVLALALLFATSVEAADWGLCGAGLQLPDRPVFDTNGVDPEATHVSADNANLVEEGISVLEGNVGGLLTPIEDLGKTCEVTRFPKTKE